MEWENTENTDGNSEQGPPTNGEQSDKQHVSFFGGLVSKFLCKGASSSPHRVGYDELEEPCVKKQRMEIDQPKGGLCSMMKRSCDLKMKRLDLVKKILDNQSRPEILEELKVQHNQLLQQEQVMCSEILQLKNSSNVTAPPDSPSSMQISSPPHVEERTSTCPKTLQRIWSGRLTLENCPQKGKSKDILVSAYAPNMCSPNIAPLVAQFEGAPAYSMATWPSTLNITGVCYSNNLHFFKKYSLRIFVLFPENQAGNAETFHFLLQQLTKNGWAGVVTLPENTLLLVPFRQEKLLGIVLSKMNITLATRSLPQPQSDYAYNMSCKYFREGELKFEDKLVDGFYDPGRSAEFACLQEYMQMPNDDKPREVLVVDSTKDRKLCSYVSRATEMLNNFADVESQARVLSLFVSNCFGGDFPSANSCAEEVVRLKESKKSNVIMIGEIQGGVCRHRAILYKYLCDRFNIECELKRGNYSSTTATGAHAWNVIKLGMQYFVVDIMHEPTQLYSIDSQKAKNYAQVSSLEGQRSECPGGALPVVRPELSCRRFVRLPNLREKAVFHERLGRGGAGLVYRITLGGLSCALKKIDIGRMSEQQKQYALQEVQVMEMLNHENIIHYLGHELIEDKKELHILMELFPMSLGHFIDKRRRLNQKFTASEIKHLAIEILNGIDYLHNQQIIHRDLKPDNILVDVDDSGKVNKVKITDFGVCKMMMGSSCNDRARVGTDIYMAPEVHCVGKTSVKADIWSFGMVLVELMNLAPPYSGLMKEEALNQIKVGQLPCMQVEASPCMQRIGDILKECLQVDPQKRPPAEQLVISFFRLQCMKEPL